MSEILTKEEEAKLYKQMLKKQERFHSLGTICGATVVSCANIAFGSLGVFEKIILVMGVLWLWSDKMAVYYAGIMKGLAKGKAPGEDDERPTPQKVLTASPQVGISEPSGQKPANPS